MGKQGAEVKSWDQSSSSTVLLDPAALVESCKQQIQGKDGIPAEHQRLIFVCRVDNQEVVPYSSGGPRAEEGEASDILKELRSWEAILKDDNHAIAKLLHPLVAAEEQLAVENEKKASRLSCQTARELRSMGISCNVYYLFFDKWIPGSLKNGQSCKATSNLSIQIDKDFQAKSFQILLFGRLNGSNLPLPFDYRMNGGEVAAQVSMQEQMLTQDIGQLQYRQGQKTRHRLGLSTQSVGKGVDAGDACPVAENIDPVSGSHRIELIDDYYCSCGKDLEFTVLVSNDRQLKCFVFKVIHVSGDASSKSKQLPSQVSGRFNGGTSVSHCHTNAYCVSSSGVSCHKCETATRDRKIAAPLSPATTSCQSAQGSLPADRVCAPLDSCSSGVPSASKSCESFTPVSDVSANQAPGCLKTDGIESVPIVEKTMAKHTKKKKRKSKRNGKTVVENGNSARERAESLSSEAAVNGSLNSSACAVVDEECEGCESSGTEPIGGRSGEPFFTEQNSGKGCRGDVKCRSGLGAVPQKECQHSDSGMAKGWLLKPDEAMKKGRPASLLAVTSDVATKKKHDAEINENPKECEGRSEAVHPEESIPSSKSTSWSSGVASLCESSGELKELPRAGTNLDHTFTCAGACPSQDRPFVGPVLMDMALQNSSSSAASSGVPDDSHSPAGDLVENLDSCDGKNHPTGSDNIVSARGGYNGSDSGSRNGRSGADGSSNRSNGRGSEEGNGASGYHGGGEGSSGGSHGSGRGGSGPGGSSGGSGGGNGNRGGGRGRNGGVWDCCRFDEDGGNGGKEGDSDERYRNSLQAESNGGSSRDYSQKKKGVCPLDQCNAPARKSYSGSVIGDQLETGSSGGHDVSATPDQSGKGNNISWQKTPKAPHKDAVTDPEDLAEETVARGPFAAAKTGTPRSHSTLKVYPPASPMNGFRQHGSHQMNDGNHVESRDGVDHYSPGQGSSSQDSFVKVTKQKRASYSLERNGDPLPGSTSRAAEESQSLGAVPSQDLLKGAWQKKISWDEPRQPAYSRVLSEAAPQVGALNGRLRMKPTMNGTQIRAHPSTNEVSSPSWSSAPCTPNGSQDSFRLQELNGGHVARQVEGTVQHLTPPGTVVPNEHGSQSRAQVGNLPFARPFADARPALDDASQKLTAWKGRGARFSGEQDRSQLRDKSVPDRERMTYSAQKWVPVENKHGGPGKGLGTQSKPSGTVTGGVGVDVTEVKESSHDSTSSKEPAISDGDHSKEDVLSSSTQSKVLRRPSKNVAGSGPDALEQNELPSSDAGERSFGHLEQASLRGILPREKIPGNSSSKPDSQGLASRVSELPRPSVPVVQTTKTSSGKILTKDVHTAPAVAPAEEETRRAVKAVLSAVQASCKDRRAAEGIAREVGYTMAEFERVLGAVSPSILEDLDSCRRSSVSRENDIACFSGREEVVSRREPSVSASCQAEEFSLCRCRVVDIPLRSFWRWYEEPSYYGAEVRAVDLQRTDKNEEDPFLAYFVPYISALQLFGFSSEEDARRFGGRRGKAGSPPNIQSNASCAKNMLATLFPMEGKVDDCCSSHLGLACSTNEQKDSNVTDRETPGIQLLYEFCEADLPQVRQPLFVKLRELSKGVCNHNSHSRGDPAVLQDLCVGDVHPASWFAVAWYPIYRISDGPLRAVFLTYHSFDHFARRSSLSCLEPKDDAGGDKISLPVVGLECYNLQGEPWFTMGGRFSKEASRVSKGLSVNPSQCLESRIASLHDVAAVMAKGIPDEVSSQSTCGTTGSNKFRHSDYEFFVKRRR